MRHLLIPNFLWALFESDRRPFVALWERPRCPILRSPLQHWLNVYHQIRHLSLDSQYRHNIPSLQHTQQSEPTNRASTRLIECLKINQRPFGFPKPDPFQLTQCFREQKHQPRLRQRCENRQKRIECHRTGRILYWLSVVMLQNYDYGH
jgi:hypothetical protein